MRKTVLALILAALMALATVSAALAVPNDNGIANGLSVACGQGSVPGHNPNCGGF